MKSKEARQDPKLIRNQFESNNVFGIPTIKKCEIKNKKLKFVGFDQIYTKKRGIEDKTIHFFIDDHKFNRVYNSPERYFKKLARYEAVLTPDFSLFTDMPLAIQIHNVFKSRWCGAYWQDNLANMPRTISF